VKDDARWEEVEPVNEHFVDFDLYLPSRPPVKNALPRRRRARTSILTLFAFSLGVVLASRRR